MGQWRSEGGGAAGPGRRPEGGAPKSCQIIFQNLYIENFLKSEKYNENVVIIF